MYRVHSKTGRGRGILIAVKSRLKSSDMLSNSPVTDADLLCVKIFNSSSTFNIAAVYISPGATLETYYAMFGFIEEQCDLTNNYMIIGPC